MPTTGSWVWQHFEKCLESKDSAKCNICSKMYKCSKSSTTGLARYLEKIHNIVKDLEQQEESTDNAAIRPSGSKLTKPEKRTRPKEEEGGEAPDLEGDVAKMMAVDGFSANQIARSSFIRNAFDRQGISG